MFMLKVVVEITRQKCHDFNVCYDQLLFLHDVYALLLWLNKKLTDSLSIQFTMHIINVVFPRYFFVFLCSVVWQHCFS